jgi:hypothetical protein
MGSCLYPCQLFAQSPSKAIQSNPSNYEDDRIKVVVQDCTRKLKDITCQATLTSKNSDRSIDLNGNTIKLVDLEGNEYYPTSIRLANRISENNSIKTELVENIPFKASFIFGKVPATLTQAALLQIPLTGGVVATAKFRNIAIIDRTSKSSGTNRDSLTAKPVTIPITSASSASTTKSASVNRETITENTSVCPDNTKVLYRATSRDYLLYICGAKNPTHYVGLAKDGTQGITLRLRYYDRTQFSADNGDVNYTIAANRLVIRKSNKIIFQDKVQVLQALSSINPVEEVVRTKPKKNSSAVNNSNLNRKSTVQPVTKVKRQPANAGE